MKQFNIQISIVTLVLGILVGILVSLLLDLSYNDLLAANPPDNSEVLRKEMAAKEAVHLTKISDLEKKNEKLSEELKSTREQLSTIKSKTKEREKTIKKLIEPKGFPAKDLLEKVNKSVTIDSSLTPCDSLAVEVTSYIQENAVKDSLYESQIKTMDSIVSVKDSVIQLKAERHNDLTNLLDQSLDKQDILVNENLQLRKQFKRQKLKSKLVTVGLMILSGTAANYLLHR